MAATIAACSSGSMPCAIAIVRLSGDQALPILDQVFRPLSGRAFSASPPRTMVYGRLLAADGGVIDRCLATYYPGPGSYTGEDMAEVFCHGSQAVAASLLTHCYALGAQPAPAGEFTRRAFLSGRMDLTEAEAVADLIHSTSELGAKAAAAQLEGSVGGAVREIRESILSILSHFYAVCDYTDEDLQPFDYQNAAAALEEAIARLNRLTEGYARGRLVREGVPVAIIGRPNAGKSTLFNALAGAEKAIVTDEAGTTRDVLEQVISCGGAPIRILDTAGLRQAESAAERIGVQRARDAAKRAQAVLCVVDRSQPLTDEDRQAMALAAASPCGVLVWNKGDLPQNPQLSPQDVENSCGFRRVFTLSAQKGTVSQLAQWLSSLAPRPDEALITSARQAQLLTAAAAAFTDALDSARAGMTADAFLSDAERGVNLLGQVTGETASADLAHEIFGRFCVGK